VFLGSHHRLGGRNVSLFDNQKLAAVRTCGMDCPKVCLDLYVKYAQVLYEKYAHVLAENRHFLQLSPTPRHGYV
jgi:hypothetical protein